MFQQLKESYPELPAPTISILSPGVYKNNGKWETKDSAFMLTTSGYWPRDSPIFDNLYFIGTQNGNSHYSFTAMESAIANSLSLVHQLIPQSKERFHIREPFTVVKLVSYILFFLIILSIILFLYFSKIII